VPGKRRLAISRLGVPNLDGFVPAAAGNLLSIGAPRHRKDPEIVRSQDTNQQKQRGKNLKKHTNSSAPSRNSQKLKEILRATVAPQRRLAISRLRVPNLDGIVPATADNFRSGGAPRHRTDTVFVRSQHTNKKEQKGKF